MTYSFLTGILKTIKNVAIVMGIPALILLLDNATKWIPDNWTIFMMPILGLISYFVKNYIENKD